jgi:hypothetical protein
MPSSDKASFTAAAAFVAKTAASPKVIGPTPYAKALATH